MSDAAFYQVWIGERWKPVRVPAMAGEGLVVPNVAAVVYRDPSRAEILLQRRDKPGEPVFGRLEVPGGRWRAGETPADVLQREVLEETGLHVEIEHTRSKRLEGTAGWPFVASQPLAVITGTEGAYPSLHVAFECFAGGQPRPLAGETADPRFWPVAEVRRRLVEDPDAFVGQTYALLTVVLER